MTEETKKKIEEAAIKIASEYNDYGPLKECAIDGANFGYSLATKESGMCPFCGTEFNLGSFAQCKHAVLKEKNAEIEKLSKEIDRVIEVADGNAKSCELLAEEITRKETKISQIEAAIKIAEEAIESLYGKIKHGDDQHRHWLRDAVKNHFSECLQSIRSMREGKKL